MRQNIRRNLQALPDTPFEALYRFFKILLFTMQEWFSVTVLTFLACTFMGSQALNKEGF